MAVLNRARAPRVPKGVVGVPRGRLHLDLCPRDKENWPVTGVMLRSKRTRRRPRRPVGQRTHPIVGMVSIDDRPEDVDDRRVPGHWEGDLIIGAHGTSAAATLVERTTRFVTILALPLGKNSEGLCDVLIDHINTIPDVMRGSLTWDHGCGDGPSCRAHPGNRHEGVLRSSSFSMGTGNQREHQRADP